MHSIYVAAAVVGARTAKVVEITPLVCARVGCLVGGFRAFPRVRDADPKWLRPVQAQPRRTHPAIGSAPRPSATPSRSASLRFWLTFHLPTSRVSGMRMPTMARSICCT